MRPVKLVFLAIFVLLVLIAVAIWPGPAARVKLSVTPLGPSADGSAKFILGVTNNSHRTREVLAGRGVPVMDGGTVMADDQRVVLGRASGTLVAVQVPAGTSSWTLIVWHRQCDGHVESTLRTVGWRLGLCQAYEWEFAHWKEIKVNIPR